MKYSFFFIFVWLLFIPMVSPAIADQPVWDIALYNPAPMEDDYMLPMPCGGAMVFRKVTVASNGPLQDEKIRLGFLNERYGYAEYWRDAYISAAFENKKGGDRYYLIGKYEVSAMQYHAIMQNDCPPAGEQMALPIVKESWFDAVSFADKYSQWLMKTFPKSLPHQGDYSGYIRLPTEEEWEFAARGGHKVSAADFSESVFPMEHPINQYAWFSGPKSRKKNRGGTSAIGLLSPNPLGLHDVLGNVDEMVFDPFRLRKLNRSHGLAGGYVVRGGSVNTPPEDLRTSLRSEKSFYNNGKPWAGTTTGFRLVVTGPAIDSRNTLNNIQKSWETLGETEEDQAVENLKKMVLEIKDKEYKKRLEEIRGKFVAEQEASKENMALAARGALRLGGFLCSRLGEKGSILEGVKKAYNICLDNDTKEYCRNEMGYSRIDEDEENFLRFMNYYADNLVETLKIYKEPLINEQYSLLIRIIFEQGRSTDIPYIELFKNHMNQYKKNGRINKDQWREACSTIRDKE